MVAAMKALSMWQPWAQLVVLGAKRIETRSWATKWRGWIWIHASKRKDPVARELVEKDPTFRRALGLATYRADAFATLPRGMIIGGVEMTMIVGTAICSDARMKMMGVPVPDVERLFGDYRDGRFAWQLRNPLMLKEPFEIKGKLGVWTFEQLPESARAELRVHHGSGA